MAIVNKAYIRHAFREVIEVAKKNYHLSTMINGAFLQYLSISKNAGAIEQNHLDSLLRNETVSCNQDETNTNLAKQVTYSIFMT